MKIYVKQCFFDGWERLWFEEDCDELMVDAAQRKCNSKRIILMSWLMKFAVVRVAS